MYALGDIYNAIVIPPTVSTTWVSMKDISSVSILITGATAGTAATINVATSAAGAGAVAYNPTNGFDGITVYWTQSAATGLWTKVTQAAAATTGALSTTAGDITVVEVLGTQLSNARTVPGATYDYIQVTHATATGVVLQTWPQVKRRPSNLRSPIV